MTNEPLVPDELMQCHPECFPGLGGDVLCLHADDDGYGDGTSGESADSLMHVGLNHPVAQNVHILPVFGEPNLSTPRPTIDHSWYSEGDQGLAHPQPQDWVQALGSKPLPLLLPTTRVTSKLTRSNCCANIDIYLEESTRPTSMTSTDSPSANPHPRRRHYTI